jgi:hypothetical protein
LVRVKGGEDERARARVLAHFEDHPEAVFYSRQLEVLYENEYFHWVTNRAVHRLIAEGRILTETRQLAIGSSIKLLWNRKYRFYRRAAAEVFDLVNRYSSAASEGSLGMQGEALVLRAFAREQFVLRGEGTNTYEGRTWEESGHDIDFIFERDGFSYGVEVKNTLGYLDYDEFSKKMRLCHHIRVRPVFAVRALPRSWANALIQSGGYAMIMRYQFYPWTQRELAKEINEKLGLPVDSPRRIADGTMEKFENWILDGKYPVDIARGERELGRIEAGLARARSGGNIEPNVK